MSTTSAGAASTAVCTSLLATGAVVSLSIVPALRMIVRPFGNTASSATVRVTLALAPAGTAPITQRTSEPLGVPESLALTNVVRGGSVSSMTTPSAAASPVFV